jgi:hypothetical protein
VVTPEGEIYDEGPYLLQLDVRGGFAKMCMSVVLTSGSLARVSRTPPGPRMAGAPAPNYPAACTKLARALPASALLHDRLTSRAMREKPLADLI